MIHRAFRYRLKPTAEQAEVLTQCAGATRFVYNLALEQRRIFGRRGRSFNFVSQGREVTALRACSRRVAVARPSKREPLTALLSAGMPKEGDTDENSIRANERGAKHD